MNKIRVLITGASGYIGKNFIDTYSNLFHFNTVSLSAGYEPDFSGISTVIHLSALVHQTKKKSPEQYFQSTQYRPLIWQIEPMNPELGTFFNSTIAVYGVKGYLNGQPEALNERSACNPQTSYAKSKFDAEQARFPLKDKNFII